MDRRRRRRRRRRRQLTNPKSLHHGPTVVKALGHTNSNPKATIVQGIETACIQKANWGQIGVKALNHPKPNPKQQVMKATIAIRRVETACIQQVDRGNHDLAKRTNRPTDLSRAILVKVQ